MGAGVSDRVTVFGNFAEFVSGDPLARSRLAAVGEVGSRCPGGLVHPRNGMGSCSNRLLVARLVGLDAMAIPPGSG